MSDLCSLLWLLSFPCLLNQHHSLIFNSLLKISWKLTWCVCLVAAFTPESISIPGLRKPLPPCLKPAKQCSLSRHHTPVTLQGWVRSVCCRKKIYIFYSRLFVYIRAEELYTNYSRRIVHKCRKNTRNKEIRHRQCTSLSTEFIAKFSFLPQKYVWLFSRHFYFWQPDLSSLSLCNHSLRT